MPSEKSLRHALKAVELRQTRKRRFDIFERIHGIVPDFIISQQNRGFFSGILARKEKNRDVYINHMLRTGMATFNLTGHERLSLEGFLQGHTANPHFHRHFEEFMITNGIAVAEARLITRLLNKRSCNRLKTLTETDQQPINAPQYERFKKYESMIGGLWGEEVVRSIAISDLAKAGKGDIESIYANASAAGENLDKRALRSYAWPIACIYLPIMERTKDHFRVFGEHSDYLAQTTAMAVNAEWYDRVKELMTSDIKWASSLKRIRELIDIVLTAQNEEVRDLESMLVAGTEIKIGIKRVHMTAIKAATEKKDKIGKNFDEEKCRAVMRDLIRVGGDIQNHVDAGKFLGGIINILKRHSFKAVKEPHESTNSDLRDEGKIWFAIMESPAFLSDDGKPFQIELRARHEKEREILEHGIYNHEAMIGKRLRGFLGMPEELHPIINNEVLMRIQARAVVSDILYLKGNHEGAHELKPAVVMVNSPSGERKVYETAFFEGSCVADVISPFINITLPIYDITMNTRSNRSTDLREKVEENAHISVTMVGSKQRYRETQLALERINELLSISVAQETQFQLAAALQEILGTNGANGTGEQMQK